MKCVCCGRSQEEIGRQEFIEDPSGELWCQLCTELCVPHRDLETWGEEK